MTKKKKTKSSFLSEKNTTVLTHYSEEALVASAEKIHRLLTIPNYKVHIFCE